MLKSFDIHVLGFCLSMSILLNIVRIKFLTFWFTYEWKALHNEKKIDTLYADGQKIYKIKKLLIFQLIYLCISF